MATNVLTNPVQLGTKAHRIYVTRLYRRSLRLAQDWYWQRNECREKSMLIRRLFDQNKAMNNPKEIQMVLARTEMELAMNHHPQPYYSRLIRVLFVERGGRAIGNLSAGAWTVGGNCRDGMWWD
ncbi:hypothetical protein PhCBS80983_g01261 [Powellomyces hirtus]|uniref:NADH dehydrogenase [ubiquinone] 1 beta subcomplex subunit 9 n=1 Tax=Powellomyces hirtus TaxID=109895 RepID=A0A507EAQ1_9FUNG|nr:hypothetical protein PhCBS80983_g01261 [Powellomyces hirtus]